MTASEVVLEKIPKPPAATPLLENGDYLTLEEFERRYEAMPWLNRAELIEGVVYVSSPVRVAHGRPHARIIGWLNVYCAATSGVDLCDNTTVVLDSDNEAQPDALLRLEPAQGGRSRVTEKDYIAGSPELVVEVAASSASIDTHEKKRIYRRNRVPEYIVWQVYDKRLDWFYLKAGEYVSLTPDAKGVIHSQMFPGLCLAVEALLADDAATVLSELQKCLMTLEHAAFVQRLSRQSEV